MTQRSPVPEWFGKDDAAPVRTGREGGGGGGGCGVLLVVLLLVATGAGGYWFMAEQKSNAAERERAARRALEEARLQSERREAERREAEAAAIAAVPAEPEPEPEPETRRSQQDIQQVLRDLNPRFRACYATALTYAPDAEGTVQLTIAIGSDGLVQTAETHVTGDLPAPVERCVQTVAKTARFSEGDEQMVAFPLAFQQD